MLKTLSPVVIAYCNNKLITEIDNHTSLFCTLFHCLFDNLTRLQPAHHYHWADRRPPRQYRLILTSFYAFEMLFHALENIILFAMKENSPRKGNNSVGHYKERLMGHMLKLMGNILPARQEAFLTLMERATRGGGVEG